LEEYCATARKKGSGRQKQPLMQLKRPRSQPQRICPYT